MKHKHCIVLALVAALCSPLGAGVVYEIEVTDHEQSPPKVDSMEILAEGRNLKIDIASGVHSGKADMIFRGDRREMVVVNHEEQTYMVIDEEMIENIAGQLSGMMSQMEEALKNVPEAQRAMVEKMMKGRMPQQAEAPKRPVAEVRKTGDRADKNGYPSVRYEVWVSDAKVRDLWVTDWDNVEGGDEVVDVFAEMADFFEGMLDAVSKMPGGAAGFGTDTSIFNDLKSLDGFPVVTEQLAADGSLENESVLRSSKRQTLDPADFEPPAGYKRQQMPTF